MIKDLVGRLSSSNQQLELLLAGLILIVVGIALAIATIARDSRNDE